MGGNMTRRWPQPVHRLRMGPQYRYGQIGDEPDARCAASVDDLVKPP